MKRRQVVRTIFVFSLVLMLLLSSSSILDAQEGEEEEEEEVTEEYIELTGTLNYVLFGLAAVMIFWKYLKKIFSELKKFHNIVKYIHCIVGFGAAGTITFHAYLTLPKWNFALIIGLVLIWAYVLTGAIFWLKKIPARLKKWSYTVHAHVVFLIITASFLYLGHLLAD